ncbi:exodeoxyribonuclease VII large subunit [Kiloniella sp. EL199]|uniref:exodeoxyribonuclease VII large subunit n=1 Tax=Kiloniella sp. EL199 TaxID=2107581 RepID=UPI000EA32ADF|nr:exodeoxyribonuclease VII large subunit [Kiloniella sp. EL199]
MNDLFSTPQVKSATPKPAGKPSNPTETRGNNAPALSVSEISNSIKRELETRFDRVRVRGEISGLKRAASGHIYMSLKDENAVLSVICWRGQASKLSVDPQDGLEVIVTGRITSYPGRSNYQIVIDSMEVAGEGALLKLLEERKKKLASEGLFADDRKRVIPFLPEVIGVVTSPTGAVIRDIMHRLSDRFPRQVLVWPVLVQGDGAAEQIARAIDGFNALDPNGDILRPDTLIVARGGGSLEDLWAFNEEVVVRAAANSKIPLISAVGHETDTTLIDFASDRRAPTPTAAAEMAVPVRAELIGEVQNIGRRIYAGANRLMGERRMQVEALARGLPDPRRLIEEKTQRLDDRVERMRNAMKGFLRHQTSELSELSARLPHPKQQILLASHQLSALSDRFSGASEQIVPLRQFEMEKLDSGRRMASATALRLERAKNEISSLDRVLEGVSYKNVLKRGFSVVRGADGNVLAATDISDGTKLNIEFADNAVVEALAGSTNSIGGPSGSQAQKSKPQKTPKKKRSETQDNAQGSLL